MGEELGCNLSPKQTIVANAYKYFKELHRKGKSAGALERTVKATGQSVKQCSNGKNNFYSRFNMCELL